MITKSCINIMNLCFFLIFSLLLLHIRTTAANNSTAVGGDANGGTDKCFVKERDALIDFKARLQDPHDSLSTWRIEVDCCTWIGVTCNNQTGHVTELDIHFSGLLGEISDSLLTLSYLNHLDLSENSFHGTIPMLTCSMTRLRYLHLGLNKLNGTIPTFNISMTRLEYLNLGFNNLSGAIPRSVGYLTKLRYLDFGFNNLNGTIPESIGSLTELRYLDLSNNSVYGIIPPEFGNLTNLQKLFLGSLGRCRVENLEWLSRLSQLEILVIGGISLAKQNHWVNVILSLRKLSYLSLRGCELSQVMYPYSSFVNSSSSVSTLYLGNNNLSSSMYGWLFPLTNNKLRDLDLSRNMLDGIPKYLGNLCSLESLTLIYNSAAIKFPDFLKNLSGCTSHSLQMLYAQRSQLTGSLPDDIQKFSSLEYLDLSYNQLNGTISEKLWELPRLGALDVSFNYLRGAISKNIGKSKIFTIYLSRNSLQGVPSTNHMSNLSYVDVIDMSSCNLGPRFPKWIQNLKNLTSLHVANSKISDTIPVEFWDAWPSQLQYLNLSSNNINGRVPNLSLNFERESVIDLSSNNFYGPVPNVSSTVVSLNLSKNKFYGGISFLCDIVGGFLEYLDLSDNSLSGQLPDCLWQFKELKVLNLGNNSIFGNLPTSFEYLIKLEALYLYENDFSGELPLSLKNCTSLNSLNLGRNNFYGNVPVWIGENLSGLYVFILRSNNFLGTIPLELCQLQSLQILDLSRNHLHGTIPSCLNNLTSMIQEGFLLPPNVHSFALPYYDHGSRSYVDHAMIDWQGNEREFIKSNLVLLKSIDLSSNNLTGQIPYELTNLYELVNLNLSKNTLLGEIPGQIGLMKNLLALDLSGNKLSGGIPSSMTQMTLLSYLDVSNNKLSGRIPSSTQLQSFEPSRYDENAGLCGLPLIKKCPGDVEPAVGNSEDDGEDVDELEKWFYIGGSTGFATGFWIACGTLLLSRRGRRAFFHLFDSFKDWVYVKMMGSFHFSKG